MTDDMKLLDRIGWVNILWSRCKEDYHAGL